MGRHVAFSQQRTCGKLEVQLLDDGNYPLYSVGRYHGSRHAWPDGRRYEITSRPQSAASGGANEYLAKILCRGTIPFPEENLVFLAPWSGIPLLARHRVGKLIISERVIKL